MKNLSEQRALLESSTRDHRKLKEILLQTPQAPECLPKIQDNAMLGEEDSTASSGTSSGQSNEYNAEIRVGEEFQAELTEYSSASPPEDYDEKAELIYHPDQVNNSRSTSFIYDFFPGN